MLRHMHMQPAQCCSAKPACNAAAVRSCPGARPVSEAVQLLCSLSHLADMMNKKSVDLTDRLSAAAKEGGLINFSKLTIELTLDVISTAAFG